MADVERAIKQAECLQQAERRSQLVRSAGEQGEQEGQKNVCNGPGIVRVFSTSN